MLINNITEEERLARVTLSKAFEPGDTLVESLLSGVSAAQAVEALRPRVPGIDEINAERVLEEAERDGIRFIIPGDVEWPGWLADLRGMTPMGLWVRGSSSLMASTSRSVAIVGSRAATTYGVQIASDLAHRLATLEFGVVSGGAFGIDQAAHRGALTVENPLRSTVVVLACGVDRVYPSAHAQLFEAVLARGGLLVSEVPPGSAPTKRRFLARNRIIAALADGMVVVEAAERSGAQNAARWATDLGRPLMGVPGPITSAASAGVHSLLKAGRAHLVTNAGDVIEVLNNHA